MMVGAFADSDAGTVALTNCLVYDNGGRRGAMTEAPVTVGCSTAVGSIDSYDSATSPYTFLGSLGRTYLRTARLAAKDAVCASGNYRTGCASGDPPLRAVPTPTLATATTLPASPATPTRAQRCNAPKRTRARLDSTAADARHL